MRVGMPRGLMFYKYYPFWQAYLDSLDVELVVSERTNKKILDLGLEAAENEFCLPLKVFYGHALSLKDKVDALLIPRLVSVHKKEFTCPKMLGLPDLIHALEGRVPPVISPKIDVRKNTRGYYRELMGLGKRFDGKNRRIVSAILAGRRAQIEYEKKLIAGMTPPEALEGDTRETTKQELTIGLVGHSYNIYDSYITLDLIKRLRRAGAKVLVPENISPETIDAESRDLPKRLFWTYEKEIVGSAFHWMKSEAVSGVIYVLAFACGPDSFIQAVIEDKSRSLGNVPVMSLVIDEHSTEGGMITRLEAFIDMLKRRDHAACNASHG